MIKITMRLRKGAFCKGLTMFVIGISFVLISCSTESDEKTDVPLPEEVILESDSKKEEIPVPSDSELSELKETKDIHADLSLKTAGGEPIPGVALEIYTKKPEDGGRPIGTAVTDENGRYKIYVSIPDNVTWLYIKYDYIGRAEGKWLQVIGNEALSAPLDGRFEYMGTFDNEGIPDYLEADRDVLGSDFLADIKASLAEGRSVPQYRRDYLADGSNTNIILLKDGDVRIAFVHEGATYRNVLGYYTYDSNNPPRSVNDIDKFTIIFPNASFQNGGGGLYPGDKVYLGNFPAGTTIGFFVIADSWDENSASNNAGNHIFYSNPVLNPESDANFRQHNVLLWDKGGELLLLGFEDLYRDSRSDEDFNDVVFYINVSPAGAIDTDNLPHIVTHVEKIDVVGEAVIPPTPEDEPSPEPSQPEPPPAPPVEEPSPKPPPPPEPPPPPPIPPEDPPEFPRPEIPEDKRYEREASPSQ